MAKVTITITDTDQEIDAKVVFEPALIHSAPIKGAQALGVDILDHLSELVARCGGEIETGSVDNGNTQ